MLSACRLICFLAWEKSCRRLLDARGDMLVAACPPEAIEQQKAVAAIFSNIWTEYNRASNAAFGSSSIDEELQMVVLDLEVPVCSLPPSVVVHSHSVLHPWMN